MSLPRPPKLLADGNELARWVIHANGLGGAIIATNGCFDVLHAGHVKYLQEAKVMGGANGGRLIVGLDSDRNVRRLKGGNRPVNDQMARAFVLSGLECVDAIFIFEDCATFLEVAMPDVYVKGGDYSLETLDPVERTVLEARNVRIEFIPLVAGFSSTATIKAVTTQWPKHNERRASLIDREEAGLLTQEESSELARLQHLADERVSILKP